MGLFGKDDRKPASPQPRPQQPRVSQGPASAPRDVTVIGRGTRFEGKITGSADMLVEGEVGGAIDGGGTITIAEPGTVKANLHARVVVIAGTVTGDVSADEKIELQPSATLKGNITAPRIL
ncbi:MAG TPA: polymer-forming cytoskeletal protein, partial [Acidobacteria bacterium]|nr:polymer-forming cytoskeletal protein [Acidobacteriota bacterium]